MAATAVLNPLIAELKRWRAVGKTAALWWRDDDLVGPSSRLERLLASTASFECPVLLGIIPALMREGLEKALAEQPLVRLCQHGLAHANYEPAGCPPAEFGPHRSTEQACADISAGFSLLSARFGRHALPVFVPPWNVVTPTTIKALPVLGIRGLSCYGPRELGGRAVNLAWQNAHVDVLDWSNRRGDDVMPLSAEGIVERLVRGLADMRRGSHRLGAAIGLLTHHRSMGDEAWITWRMLMDTLRESGAAVFSDPIMLFGFATRQQ